MCVCYSYSSFFCSGWFGDRASNPSILIPNASKLRPSKKRGFAHTAVSRARKSIVNASLYCKQHSKGTKQLKFAN